uniref:Dihydropteridine reductase n=1 Tax=Steinernema glaseri TaxID=37863 RepID=A0A1I7YWP1_9BILA
MQLAVVSHIICRHYSKMSAGRVLVYGGNGALGAAVVDFFKANQFWTISVDLRKNEKADACITVDPATTWEQQEQSILSGVKSTIGSEKLDAVLCVAGGWAGGNASSADMIKNADLMWKQSVWSSAISARIAAEHLKENGLIQLTGAAPALDGTPGMIGYGMAKAAVQQLTRSLAGKASGLPNGTCSLAILPVTLDTPMNRKWMPKADFSTWTPLEFIAESFHKWTVSAAERPESGSLLKLETIGGKTTITKV